METRLTTRQPQVSDLADETRVTTRQPQVCLSVVADESRVTTRQPQVSVVTDGDSGGEELLDSLDDLQCTGVSVHRTGVRDRQKGKDHNLMAPLRRSLLSMNKVDPIFHGKVNDSVFERKLTMTRKFHTADGQKMNNCW